MRGDAVPPVGAGVGDMAAVREQVASPSVTTSRSASTSWKRRRTRTAREVDPLAHMVFQVATVSSVLSTPEPYEGLVTPSGNHPASSRRGRAMAGSLDRHRRSNEARCEVCGPVQRQDRRIRRIINLRMLQNPSC